jgi:hypothetical protein
MPIAMAPTEGGIDARGTFTGGVLPSEVGAAIIYTAVTKVDRAHETIRAEAVAGSSMHRNFNGSRSSRMEETR